MSTKSKKKHISVISEKHASNPVAQAVQLVLKDTYALYLVTHNYHWNVEGRDFVSLHTLFETQYNELFAAIDTIAERIRALDVYALPNHYEAILESIQNLSNPLNKSTSKSEVAERMVRNLLEMNGTVIDAAHAAKKTAAREGDNGTQDLMIARIQVHEKASWMLRSIIK